MTIVLHSVGKDFPPGAKVKFRNGRKFVDSSHFDKNQLDESVEEKLELKVKFNDSADLIFDFSENKYRQYFNDTVPGSPEGQNFGYWADRSSRGYASGPNSQNLTSSILPALPLLLLCMTSNISNSIRPRCEATLLLGKSSPGFSILE